MKPAFSYKILIVADESGVANSIAFLLSSKGHVCDRACDAIEALWFFNSTKYDFVITDVVMSGMDGVAFIHKLSREDPTLRIMAMNQVSKNMGGHTDQEAIEAGACICIRRPFFMGDFWSQFQILTSRAQGEQPS
jgi:DNA-binding response OmpR family regulator